MDPELLAMQDRLLWRLHVPLTNEQGDEAFERHVLLAVKVTVAADIFGNGDNGKLRWMSFFESCFPQSLYPEEIASMLWEDWRNGLVHDGSPRRVGLTQIASLSQSLGAGR